jgi:membrane peptidoglycan carboxypeptidase
MKKNAKNIKAILKPSVKDIKKPTLLARIKLPTSKKSKTQRRQDVRLHQHLLERFKTKKEMRLRKRAEYLATLPKGRLNKLLYILHPKRVARYVFSRDGLIMGMRIVGIGVLLMVVTSFVVFAYYRKDLPKNITDLKACSQGQKTSYYDRTGEVLLWRGEGDVDCQPVALNQMSDYLKHAVIAAEDQKFYSHPGFDVKGTLRATLSNARGSDAQQGGSTITQQYVKLAVLSNSEKRISRKIKELILSIELERTYKKDEILQAYLNEVSLGGVYNGAEAASQGFFNKPAKDLTLDEAATFAAAIQAPGTYWEAQNQASLIERRNNYVLPNMVKLGYITKDQAEAAKKVDTIAKVSKSNSKYKDIKAAHFVIETQNQLEAEFGSTNIRRQGYKVITTLDMTKQKFAEDAVAQNIPNSESANFDNAALVSEDVATGQIVAYVGSRDFNYPGYGQKNIAATPRSPGSSVKPYDYASLMKSSENWGAGSIMYDWKTQLPGWPANAPLTDFGNNPGNGPSTIRYLLGNSKNIPAAKATYIAGLAATHDLEKKLGVKSGFVNCGLPCDTVLSTAIGDGGEIRLDEHVNGFASFSRGGKYIPQQFVLKILDSKGKVIRDNTKEPVGEQVLDPQIAYIISDILSDQHASYFRGSPSYRHRVLGNFDDAATPTAIKTGTTAGAENGWMMGYTPKYATGVWVGNSENKSLNTNNMEYLSGPIWGAYMQQVAASEPIPERWAKPEGIKTVTLDSAFYSLVKGACGGSTSCGYNATDIYPSWYTPRKSSSNKQKVVIDTVSNKRATDCTPQAARKELTSGGIIVPELDPSDPYYKQFMDPITAHLKTGAGDAIPADNQIDDVHSCSDVKPTVTLDNISNCSSTCTFTARPSQGTHPVKNIYFKMDGQTMAGGAFDISDNSPVNFTVTPDFGGNHDISVQIVDNALYDTTSGAQTVNFTSVPFVLEDPMTTATNVKLTWDALDPGSSYTVFWTNSAGTMSSSFSSGITCTSGAGSKCTVSKLKATYSSGSFHVTSSNPTRTSNTVSY